MKHLTVRLPDSVHAALSEELKEWQKLRGPRFSLNNLCEEKLSTPFPPTQWIASSGTIGNEVNYVYTVTYGPYSTSPTINLDREKSNGKRRKPGKQ